MLALVPKKLKQWHETLSQSVEDMKDDFMLAIKKAIVDFVLQDPAFIKPISDDSRPYKKELNEIGDSFRPSFKAAKLKLRNLHIVNPCLAALPDIWYSRFR